MSQVTFISGILPGLLVLTPASNRRADKIPKKASKTECLIRGPSRISLDRNVKVLDILDIIERG